GRAGVRGEDRAHRGVRRVPHVVGVAAERRGRAGRLRLVPAAGPLAAGGAGARAAGGGADRAEPARVGRLRAGGRPGPGRAVAGLAEQRGLVRVGGAGGGGGGHLRRALRGPAAAARPAVLAGRGGGLVGERRGAQGPVAVRLPLGPP